MTTRAETGGRGHRPGPPGAPDAGRGALCSTPLQTPNHQMARGSTSLVSSPQLWDVVLGLLRACSGPAPGLPAHPSSPVLGITVP